MAIEILKWVFNFLNYINFAPIAIKNQNLNPICPFYYKQWDWCCSLYNEEWYKGKDLRRVSAEFYSISIHVNALICESCRKENFLNSPDSSNASIDHTILESENAINETSETKNYVYQEKIN